MPSQYPRIYREPAIEAGGMKHAGLQTATPSRLMLVSCTEAGGWQKIESVEEVLAHFSFASGQPQSRRSPFGVITKAFLGFSLLAASVGAGAFGHILVTRANELFLLPTALSAASSPTPVTAVTPAPATVTPPTVPVATQPAPAPVAFSLEEGVGRAVDQIRAGLPRKIDALVSVVGVKNEGTRIIYENRIAMDGTKIDGAKKGKMHEQIVANTCNTPGPRKLLEFGVAFRYLYVDMKEKPVMTTDVTKANCI